MSARPTLPVLGGALCITDGGLETTLAFHEGIDLPCFAAFPLLDDERGRAALTRYYEPYFDIAARDEVGIVVDTPTWRANPDWGGRLGYSAGALASVNRRSVELVRELASQRPTIAAVLDGVVGPRGDGYAVGEVMTVADAARYHTPQIQALQQGGVDMVSAVTMTYVEEAIGVALAASEADVPVVISFTVETDGRLPSGRTLAEAIDATDEATGCGPRYYMINCAHPSHFRAVLEAGGEWTARIGAVRANASRLSHQELDEAAELDRGDPAALAGEYLELRSLLPRLCVVGGCCGTDDAHISAISAALRSR